MNAAFQGPSGRGSGAKADVVDNGYWQEQFHQVIYTLFLVPSLVEVP